MHKFYLFIFCLLSVLSVYSINPDLPYTGWDTQGVKGNVARMTITPVGEEINKEVLFDADGNITSITDQYQRSTFNYTDLFHYTTDQGITMEVEFPTELHRLERGAIPDGEIGQIYAFDEQGRLEMRAIVENEMFVLLSMILEYEGNWPFPAKMEVSFVIDTGREDNFFEYDYQAFDHRGNWVQRMVSGWQRETDGELVEFRYTELAAYEYRTEEAEVNLQTPDFFSYIPNDNNPIVPTEFDGVFSSFDSDFRFGWTMFFLIPKEDPKAWFNKMIEGVPDDVGNEWEKLRVLEESFKTKTFDRLSAEFNIYAYHIPKEYLLYFPAGDSPFEPYDSRSEFIYKLDFDSEQSNLIEKIDIHEGKRFSIWPWLERLLENK